MPSRDRGRARLRERGKRRVTACTRGVGAGRTAQAETVVFTIRRAGAQGAR